MRKIAVLALASLLTSCSEWPTAPTPIALSEPSPQSRPLPEPATPPTRIITLKGENGERVVNVGQVAVGGQGYKTFYVCNDGNSQLAMLGVDGPDGYWFHVEDWWDGGNVVDPGKCQLAQANFRPTATKLYDGTITVRADHTSGINTIPISGTGTRPQGP